MEGVFSPSRLDDSLLFWNNPTLLRTFVLSAKLWIPLWREAALIHCLISQH